MGVSAGPGLGMPDWIQLWVGLSSPSFHPLPPQPPGAQVSRELALVWKRRGRKEQMGVELSLGVGKGLEQGSGVRSSS